VTLLMTDIEASTRSWERGPQQMRVALERHDDIMNRVIAGHHGHVLIDRGEGDSFFAVFSRPSDAVSAALAVQRALATEAWPGEVPILVRMAIHTGEVAGDFRGSEVNRCARLRALGSGGQVLLSEAAQALVRSNLPVGASLLNLGSHRLRDLAVPEQVFQLLHPELESVFPPLRTGTQVPNNLPAEVTTFIGRDRECGEVRSLLTDHRLVTLTGAGGSGKTRLALEVCSDLQEGFPDGVWLVELASISDPGQVVSLIAEAVGYKQPDLPALSRFLRDQEVLMLVDNCEHVLAASSSAAEHLLKGVPLLRIVATSREPLHLAGEAVWQIPTLSLPQTQEERSPDELASSSEAVRLFLDRARCAQPGFKLTEQNATAVAQICRQLDGMPLALELAAARVRVMAPEEIVRRLGDRFRLLTSGSAGLARHQTLRSTIDWSHSLLDDLERAVFRRLAVVVGSFTLETAEAVAGGPEVTRDDVIDLVASLVDKSLLQPEPQVDGTVRFRMLDTMRQYGVERLRERGEEEQTRRRHLLRYAGLAEAGYRERHDRTDWWLAELEIEHDNFRVALATARQTDARIQLALASALGWFWHLHSHLGEGRKEVELALATAEGESSESARGLCALAMISAWQGDIETAKDAAERSVAIWRRMDGPEFEVGLGLEALGWYFFFAGDNQQALARMEEALGLYRRTRNPRLIVRGKMAVAQALIAIPDVERTRRLAEEVIVEHPANRSLHDVHNAYHFLGDCGLWTGNVVAAEPMYRRAFDAALQYGDTVEACFELEGIAMALAGQGRDYEAVVIRAGVEAYCGRLGISGDVPFWTELKSRYLQSAEQRLEPAELQAARRDGMQRDFRRLLEYAAASGGAAPTSSIQPGPLSVPR
jgi:predicted ATPase/class 3 adenylate cyclase